MFLGWWLVKTQDGQVAHLAFGPLTTLKFPVAARRPPPLHPVPLLSAPLDAPIPNGRPGAGEGTLATSGQLLSPPPMHPLPPSAAAPGGADLVIAEELLLPLPGTRGALARRGRCSSSSRGPPGAPRVR